MAVESSLELGDRQRSNIVYRLDGGSGTDENLAWLLDRGYQIVAKGFSGRRAHVLAQQVRRWDQTDSDAFVGSVASPMNFSRPTWVIVKKWQKEREKKAEMPKLLPNK